MSELNFLDANAIAADAGGKTDLREQARKVARAIKKELEYSEVQGNPQTLPAINHETGAFVLEQVEALVSVVRDEPEFQSSKALQRWAAGPLADLLFVRQQGWSPEANAAYLREQAMEDYKACVKSMANFEAGRISLTPEEQLLRVLAIKSWEKQNI